MSGTHVGDGVGFGVGAVVVGDGVGAVVVGDVVGFEVDGEAVGEFVGDLLGDTVGVIVGATMSKTSNVWPLTTIGVGFVASSSTNDKTSSGLIASGAIITLIAIVEERICLTRPGESGATISAVTELCEIFNFAAIVPSTSSIISFSSTALKSPERVSSIAAN